jgi:hypothetical protein
MDSDVAPTRDVHSYALTYGGMSFLKMGHALHGRLQRSVRFSGLPFSPVVALNLAAKKHNDSKTPFSVLNPARRGSAR